MSTTYLIDTSVWIEYFRDTGSESSMFVKDLLTSGAEVAITEPIAAEILAGAKSPAELRELERLTEGLPSLPVDSTIDYHELARIYRASRETGRTIRKLFDCLIAAVALRTGAVLVHNDRDFDRIAEVFPRLRTQQRNKD